MAQTQKLLERAQLHFVVEATQDTYVAPAGDGTNIILVENATFTFDSNMRDFNYVRSGGLKGDPVRGAIGATMTFDVPLRGSGTAGTAPEYGACLLACGLQQSITAATSVEYTPLLTFDGATDAGPPALTNPGISYSCTLLEDGTAYSMRAAFGNVVFNVVAGEPTIASFTFQGCWRPVAADALETGGNAPAYQTTIAQPFVGASLSINDGGAYSPVGVENMTFDLGNTIKMGKDVNGTYGYYGARITGRRSTGSFDPEHVAVATQPWVANWAAGTTMTLTTGTIGATAGNIYQFDVTRAALLVPSPTDSDGVRKWDLPFQMSSLPTDEEGDANEPDFVLTFT